MTTKEGTLRVWNVINPGSRTKKLNQWTVSSPDEAIAVINREADWQLKQSWVYVNAFGLEVFENGEWVEWYSEDGMDIREYEEMLDGE